MLKKHYVRALAHYDPNGYGQIQLWNPGPYLAEIEEINIICPSSFVLLRNDGIAYRLPHVADGYNPGVPVDFTAGLCSQGACSTCEIRHASGPEVLGTILEQGEYRKDTDTGYKFDLNKGIMVRPGEPGKILRVTFKWWEIDETG